MRLHIIYIIGIVLSLLLTGCNGRQGDSSALDNEMRYAELLEMQETDSGTVARIHDPWNRERVAIEYHISQPQQRVTLSASSHGYLLSQLLDAANLVTAYCDAQYVMDSTLQARLRDGLILDAGSSLAPNLEVLAATRCDAIWLCPMEGSNTLSALGQHLGTQVICCADYMESTPLGRAEWMRFYGRLIGKGAVADSLFLVIEERYLTLTAHSDSLRAAGDSCQTLMAEMPYQATWYVPGGRSTTAQLYHDAGLDYLWADDTHAGSLALSPEAVLDKAHDADIWLVKYYDPSGDWTLDDFIGQHPYFPQFKAAQCGEVYGCNTAVSDYFDVAPFRPDLILESLIERDEKYFKPLP